MNSLRSVSIFLLPVTVNSELLVAEVVFLALAAVVLAVVAFLVVAVVFLEADVFLVADVFEEVAAISVGFKNG